MRSIIKIAITGPESTGKSMVSQYLADYYQTVWVPEFARAYLMSLNRPYNYDDILIIAKGQVDSERALIPLANRLLFADTELLVTKIWCDVKYGKCHQWIEEQLLRQDYHLYLLMDIDMPWEYDPLREYPDGREFLMERYIAELKRLKFPFRIINGLGQERFDNAVKAVEEVLQTHHIR